MRIAPIILLLFLTWPALAQTPDTTSAWRYYPLQVGNVWEYEQYSEVCPFDMPCEPVQFEGFMRRHVVRDSVIDGQRYFSVSEANFRPDGEQEFESMHVVRFDTLSARLLTEPKAGSEIPWPEQFGCPLNAPFDTVVGCGYDEDFLTEGGYEQELLIGGDVVTGAAKTFLGYLYSSTFLADVGEVWNSEGKFSYGWRELVYAHIDGVEYGTPFPVATEGSPESDALALTVFPNPLRGTAAVRFTLDRPQRVTLAVYDVLGRRVLTHDLGARQAGEATHRLDVASLPAGVYVIRLSGDAGMRATTRIVRN